MKVLSMRGKEVDMDRLMSQNAKKMAVGNANMNARGDIVANGQVIRTNEAISEEYNKSSKSVRQVGLKNLANEIMNNVVLKPDEAVKQIKEAAKEHHHKTKRKMSDTEAE